VIIGVLMLIAVLTNDSLRALIVRAARPAKDG
jgi:hypothetical protein